ncbi:MAG: hypothetical protein AAFO81_12050 [Pseudomonadota bacterium]
MSAISLIHIIAGTLAFIAGVAALVALKGQRRHRQAGRIFCASLLATALAGSAMALLRMQAITALAGLLTTYLIVTGWQTVTVSDPRKRITPPLATAGAILTAVALLVIAAVAMKTTDGHFQGFAAGDYLFLATIAALAAGGDVCWLASQGYTDHQRIARHLWRLCTGMFFATGSLFNGPGAHVFPEIVRDSGILVLPELLVLMTMIFWLWRLRRQHVAVRVLRNSSQSHETRAASSS